MARAPRRSRRRALPGAPRLRRGGRSPQGCVRLRRGLRLAGGGLGTAAAGGEGDGAEFADGGKGRRRREKGRGLQGTAGGGGPAGQTVLRRKTVSAAGGRRVRRSRTGLRAPSLRLAGGAPDIYLWRGEKKLAPEGGIFERNVKFAAKAKKCAKPLDFFAEMITIVYS